jgi:hypothetical protein
LLTTLVSLRVFKTDYHSFERRPEQGYTLFFAQVFYRAPNLEYIAVSDGKLYCGKRIRGGWAVCEEAELP